MPRRKAMPERSFGVIGWWSAGASLLRIVCEATGSEVAECLTVTSSLVFTALLCLAVSYVFRRLVMKWGARVIERSPMKWDDLYLKWHVFDRLLPFAPVAAEPSGA